MKILTKIKELIWPPKWTHKQMPANKKNQTQETKCFKDGKYSHSVIMHYFTKEQIKRLTKITTKTTSK